MILTKEQLETAKEINKGMEMWQDQESLLRVYRMAQSSLSPDALEGLENALTLLGRSRDYLVLPFEEAT